MKPLMWKDNEFTNSFFMWRPSLWFIMSVLIVSHCWFKKVVMLCCVLLTHEIQSSVCCSVTKDYFLSGGEGFQSGKNKRNKYVYEGAAWMFLCEYKLLHVLITDYSFTVTDLRPSRSRRLRFSFLVCKNLFIRTKWLWFKCEAASGGSSWVIQLISSMFHTLCCFISNTFHIVCLFQPK